MKSLKFGILILTALSLLFSCAHSIPFNGELWNSDSSADPGEKKLSPRQQMIDGVLELIEGKSRQEVISILGEETDTDKFPYYSEDLIYVLGPERSYFSIDYEWLHLSFDKNDRLIQSELITD